MMLLRIVAPHFVAGVEIRRGVVTATVPITRYMLGWTPGRVQTYCRRKGWEYWWDHDDVAA